MTLEEMLAAITAHTSEAVIVGRQLFRDSEGIAAYATASVHGKGSCAHGSMMLASASERTPEACVAAVLKQLSAGRCVCVGCEDDRAIEAAGAEGASS